MKLTTPTFSAKVMNAWTYTSTVPLYDMCISLYCVVTYQKNEVILYKNFSHGVNFNYLSVNRLPVIWSLFRICKIFGTAVSWSGVMLAWTGLG